MEGIIEQLKSYLLHGTGELVCYAAFFALIETFWPAAAGQPRWRSDSRLDVAYSYLIPLLAFPVYYLVLSLAVHGFRQLPPAGLLARLHAFVSRRNIVVQAVAAIFISDLSGYWRHRLLHTRWLWPFHAIHHSSEQVDWLSNERVHPFESVVTSLEQLLTLMLLGFGPPIVAINAFARRTHSFFEHSNLKLSYGPLNYFIVSPRFHRWHHSDDPRVAHKNFANFFSCIDLAFGSFFLPAGETASSFGLFDGKMPGGFVSHMLYPLKRLAGMLRRRPDPAPAPPASVS